MGGHGTARGQRYEERQCGTRHCLFAANAEKRRFLGRGLFHWNRIPACVLSGVPHVPAVFPADRADRVRQGDGGTESGGLAISTQHSALGQTVWLRTRTS